MGCYSGVWRSDSIVLGSILVSAETCESASPSARGLAFKVLIIPIRRYKKQWPSNGLSNNPRSFQKLILYIFNEGKYVHARPAQRTPKQPLQASPCPAPRSLHFQGDSAAAPQVFIVFVGASPEIEPLPTS